jgi:hypothetical protein
MSTVTPAQRAEKVIDDLKFQFKQYSESIGH